MDQHLKTACRVLQSGGLVAYPTEAVYGLGCDPFNQAAVERLLAVKRRPRSKGLILAGASLSQLLPYITLTTAQQRQLEATWPAPVTFLVPASDALPDWVRGDHTTVAVRVPDHPVARALAAEVGQPIISTSANLNGEPAARNQADVARRLAGELDFIVPGTCDRARKPSTIIDLATGRTLRE